MFEYHGWATIRENPYFAEDGNLDSVVDKIKSYINNLKWNSGVLDICPTNGEYHLLLSGFSNHNGEEKVIIDLFEFIALKSPGSYGLLYMKDDEALNGNDNCFRVMVLSRGKVCEHTDPFLSPFIPVVEDESND